MIVSATLKYIRISPQKVRLVANQIRGLPVDKALSILKFSPKRAACFIDKLLNSAISNAEHNLGADIDELLVSTIYVNNGPVLKRIRTRAKGRADRILKRSCHITIMLSDEKGDK